MVHTSRAATYAMAKGDGKPYRPECSSMALETAHLSAWRWRRHMQAGHQAPSSCKEEEAALVRHEVAVAELLQAQAPPVDPTKETATASSSNTAAEGKSKSKGKGQAKTKAKEKERAKTKVRTKRRARAKEKERTKETGKGKQHQWQEAVEGPEKKSNNKKEKTQATAHMNKGDGNQQKEKDQQYSYNSGAVGSYSSSSSRRRWRYVAGRREETLVEVVHRKTRRRPGTGPRGKKSKETWHSSKKSKCSLARFKKRPDRVLAQANPIQKSNTKVQKGSGMVVQHHAMLYTATLGTHAAALATARNVRRWLWHIGRATIRTTKSSKELAQLQ